MESNTREDAEVVRVSPKGQATIPKRLRDKFGIDTPGEVLVYEQEGKIVVEPAPSLTDLRGIHGGEHDPGEVVERLRELREADERREREADERLP